MSGGKGSSGSGYVSYDYYGTIAAVLRAGPMSMIERVLVDGQQIWLGPIHRTDLGVGNPYTLAITDTSANWLQPGGYVKLYWGDDTQTVSDPALVGHPPYRGMAYMVFHNFLFGRERTTAPNIEVIGQAVANPPATIIPATAPDGFSGSVNPWAILAEFLTSIHGPALPSTRLDAASWQACHDFFTLSSDSRLLTYCAPLYIDQTDLRTICNDLLSLCDGGLRLKTDGTIEAFYYPVDPGDLSAYTTLTANDLTEAMKATFGSWDAVPTGVTVDYVDGNQWFVDWAIKADDLRALKQAVEPRRETLQAPMCIHKSQALRLGAEWTKRKCQPQINGTIVVRPERAVNLDGSPLRVGNRFLLDIQPEPGGAGLLQLCRVLSRRFKSTGPVTIDFMGEVLQPAVPFTPVFEPPSNEEIDVAALAAAQVIATPLKLTGGTPAVSLLGNRGDTLTIGAHLLFDVDGGSGTFTNLGTQIGFAVPCQLAADYAADATGAIEVTLTDTKDQNVALDQPGPSGAQNDQLLLVVYHTTVDGYIDENADGTPIIEWFSIQSSAVVSGNTYNFTVLRARLDSQPAAWSNGDVAWIIPRLSLIAFEHVNFQDYVNAHTNLVFRGNPFSKFGEYDGAPTNLPFHFPTSWQRVPQIAWTTPAAYSSALPGTGNLTPAATATSSVGSLVRMSLYYVRQDTGVQTMVFDVPFANSGSKSLADCFTLANVATPINFAGDPVDDITYVLTLRVADSYGNVVESTRSLVRLATGGGSPGLLPPTFTPGSSKFSNFLNISIDAVAPATKIQGAGAAYGGPLPAPGSWVTTAATHVAGTIGASLRSWARAGDGSGNWSAWVFADYLKE